MKALGYITVDASKLEALLSGKSSDWNSFKETVPEQVEIKVFDKCFEGICLTNVNLSSICFKNCSFKNCLILDSNIDHSKFIGCYFYHSDLLNCSIHEALIDTCFFQNSIVSQSDFYDTEIVDSNIYKLDDLHTCKVKRN